MALYYLSVFVGIFFDVLSFLILARVLLSWVPSAMNHRVAYVIKDVTEPILNLVKKVTPNLGMLDLSPMIAIIALDVIKRILLQLLSSTLL